MSKQLEKQISEMWDAVKAIPEDDPARDRVSKEAAQAENRMRAMGKQTDEQIRSAAPDLLNALTGGEDVSMLYDISWLDCLIRKIKGEPEIILLLNPDDPDAAWTMIMACENLVKNGKAAIEKALRP